MIALSRAFNVWSTGGSYERHLGGDRMNWEFWAAIGGFLLALTLLLRRSSLLLQWGTAAAVLALLDYYGQIPGGNDRWYLAGMVFLAFVGLSFALNDRRWRD
jgi:hypothetical protein